MKKLILKKDIIEVLDSMVQQSVMAGEAETAAGKTTINKYKAQHLHLININ